jgi:DNA-directed RNA polymerase specialized sigma24 family protein
LRRIAYALCGDWHQADDLVQIVLAKLCVARTRATAATRDAAQNAWSCGEVEPLDRYPVIDRA